MRNIIHNWSDTDCRKILINTASAMDMSYSRLLIEDFVLPNTGASYRAASMDLHMLFTLGAIERTESHWRKLLSEAGLEIVRIWVDGNPEHEAVIETRRASEM